MADIIRPIEPFQLTQGFGENPASYAKFGLAGHNGWDLRTKHPDTPDGKRDILASWLMEFYRRGSDPTGYGIFFETICRLKRTWKLTFGHCDHVLDFKTKRAGETMAISDNTGNSTGSHLHLTVKPIRIENGQHINLEQNNGYFGAINPQEFFDELRQYIKEGGTMPGEIMQIEVKDYERLRTGSESYDKTVRYLEIETADPTLTPFEKVQQVIQGIRSRGTDLQNQLNTALAEVKNRVEQVGRLNDQLLEEQKLRKALTDAQNTNASEHQKTVGLLQGRIDTLQSQVDTLAKEKGGLNGEIATLQGQITTLEKEKEALKKGALEDVKHSLTWQDCLTLLVAKLFQGGN